MTPPNKDPDKSVVFLRASYVKRSTPGESGTRNEASALVHMDGGFATLHKETPLERKS